MRAHEALDRKIRSDDESKRRVQELSRRCSAVVIAWAVNSVLVRNLPSSAQPISRMISRQETYTLKYDVYRKQYIVHSKSKLHHLDDFTTVNQTSKALRPYLPRLVLTREQLVPPAEQEIASNELKPWRKQVAYIIASATTSQTGQRSQEAHTGRFEHGL